MSSVSVQGEHARKYSMGNAMFFNNEWSWWIEVYGTLDLVVMGKTVSANVWPPIHGFGHVRVTAIVPFVESAKSL